MRYATLAELPSPPRGKTGWPWTASSPRQTDTESDASVLPQISVVTTSYNQAQFIEETIRSVLLQGYPNLEYLVIDGGSTDGSVDIICKYAPWLSFWVSAPDQGQVYALAKGFARSTGTILAFLNSDDVYFPDVCHSVARAFSLHPDAVAICGNELWIDGEGKVISEERTKSVSLRDLLHLKFLPQPTVFFRRPAFEAVGGLDLQFQHIFDFDLWLRLANRGEFRCIPDLLAATRWHPEVKRMTRWPEMTRELERAIPKALSSPLSISLSREERKSIYTNLMYHAAKVYWVNSPKYIWRAVVSSVAAVANRPSLAPPLIRQVFSRIYQLFNELCQRVGRHRSEKEIWWAGKQTGIHWADWQSHSPLASESEANVKVAVVREPGS